MSWVHFTEGLDGGTSDIGARDGDLLSHNEGVTTGTSEGETVVDVAGGAECSTLGTTVGDLESATSFERWVGKTDGMTDAITDGNSDGTVDGRTIVGAPVAPTVGLLDGAPVAGEAGEKPSSGLKSPIGHMESESVEVIFKNQIGPDARQ